MQFFLVLFKRKNNDVNDDSCNCILILLDVLQPPSNSSIDSHSHTLISIYQ